MILMMLMMLHPVVKRYFSAERRVFPHPQNLSGEPVV
uniref:Uncharacterized protein n=1 Tax=Anguilla anguilla TaxID=7936 RepID=A0A0E9U0U0_ANGAN